MLGPVASPAFGKLVPKNIVTTYLAAAAGLTHPINLPAVAVASGGKYGPGVFPAVVCKARIPIRGVPETVPSAASLYPLQRRVKIPKSAESKSQTQARNKKIKAILHAEEQAAPKHYISATDSQFKSGENVVAGGTSVAANQLVAYMFIRRLSEDLKIELMVYNFQVQNIVCSTNLGFELNPDWIVHEADANGWEVYFEPEEFIGLSWVTNDDGIKIVFVVFSSGNIVATGMKSMDQIPVAEERLHRLIVPFRRGNEPAGFAAAAHSHMRDSDTLGVIKTAVLSGSATAGYQHAKINAAKRNSKKLTQEMREMMKQVECVMLEDAEVEAGDSFLEPIEEDEEDED